MFVRIVPLVLSSLVLGAHFLRTGSLLLTALFAAYPLLLLVRKSWSLSVVQALTFMGAGVWINTTIQFIHERAFMGRPWGRLAVILWTVTAFTLFAGWLLHSPKVRNRYRPQ